MSHIFAGLILEGYFLALRDTVWKDSPRSFLSGQIQTQEQPNYWHPNTYWMVLV